VVIAVRAAPQQRDGLGVNECLKLDPVRIALRAAWGNPQRNRESILGHTNGEYASADIQV
jgi:hypothetical protein